MDVEAAIVSHPICKARGNVILIFVPLISFTQSITLSSLPWAPPPSKFMKIEILLTR